MKKKINKTRIQLQLRYSNVSSSSMTNVAHTHNHGKINHGHTHKLFSPSENETGAKILHDRSQK